MVVSESMGSLLKRSPLPPARRSSTASLEAQEHLHAIGLHGRDFNIMAALAGGATLTAEAAKYGVTKQSIYGTRERLFERHPELVELVGRRWWRGDPSQERMRKMTQSDRTILTTHLRALRREKVEPEWTRQYLSQLGLNTLGWKFINSKKQVQILTELHKLYGIGCWVSFMRCTLCHEMLPSGAYREAARWSRYAEPCRKCQAARKRKSNADKRERRLEALKVGASCDPLAASGLAQAAGT